MVRCLTIINYQIGAAGQEKDTDVDSPANALMKRMDFLQDLGPDRASVVELARLSPILTARRIYPVLRASELSQTRARP